MYKNMIQDVTELTSMPMGFDLGTYYFSDLVLLILLYFFLRLSAITIPSIEILV